MRIIQIEIKGFKGKHINLPLTGRDLIRAANMSGKTTVREALDFFATGSVQGLKREDLIDYAPEGRFEVGVRMDSGLSVVRWFRVKKGGKTEMDLTFDPDGLEESLTERTERLHEEFEDAPLVTFDLTAFLTGDDTHRLNTCMEFAPRTDGGEEEVTEAIREVQGQLQGFSTKLPTNLMERCTALAGLVKDRWAKDTRAQVNTSTKALRALGNISREDGVSGVNVESLAEQVRQAQTSLDELQRAAGAAEERRKLIHDLTDRIEGGQAKKKLVDAEVTEMAAALNEQMAEKETAHGKAMLHEEEEQERIQNVHDRIEALEAKVADYKTDRGIEEGYAAKAKTRLDRLGQERAALRALINHQEAALVALDAADGRCTVCGHPIDSDSKELLLVALREKVNADLRNLESLDARVEAADVEYDEHFMLAAQCRTAIEIIYPERIEEARAELQPLPYPGLTPDAIQDVISDNERRLEKSKLEQDALKKSIFGWMQERGELANELPEELEAQAVEGAERRRDQLTERLEEAKRARQRFEDQERLRKELDTAERRLEALKLWSEALGLKGLAGKMLADQFLPVIEPAGALIRRTLPETGIKIKWYTPRGKPGMRVYLVRGDDEIAYSAMSGAERAVVGTALILAFAGLKTPPAVLCLECEVMDDQTEERYLEALADLAGPTALLVMTHHGHNDMGIYTIRNL